MEAATSFPIYTLSPLLAEVACFCWVLCLDIDMDFQRVGFETDYLQLFQRWKRRSEGVVLPWIILLVTVVYVLLVLILFVFLLFIVLLILLQTF